MTSVCMLFRNEFLRLGIFVELLAKSRNQLTVFLPKWPFYIWDVPTQYSHQGGAQRSVQEWSCTVLVSLIHQSKQISEYPIWLWTHRLLGSDGFSIQNVRHRAIWRKRASQHASVQFFMSSTARPDKTQIFFPTLNPRCGTISSFVAYQDVGQNCGIAKKQQKWITDAWDGVVCARPLIGFWYQSRTNIVWYCLALSGFGVTNFILIRRRVTRWLQPRKGRFLLHAQSHVTNMLPL